MDLSKRSEPFQMGMLDIALLKIAVFAATLLLAKLWAPVLSLDWYWYLIVWILAALKPLYSFLK